ncbi:sodium:proton antiporter [Lactobacillus sp. Sy-1]|uniref:cation:proton antiporter n=1 Tax=Lactobacillus sp. Sy-1 TaxID=2109645 RepID=UPI001C5A60F7|nr:sodium:proton antiporter [Lactobacillus sp. Sy-1]MBW1605933.1 sodium:proton antiporter [Lactobacillus sp. Sy-1]
MVIIELIILLVVLLLISTVIGHYLPLIPGSLIQIGLGLLLSIFTNFQINFETEWFLLLFIAPLLFNDGKRFPKRELWQLKLPIFVNAIALVVITMVVGGVIINWLIPEMPFAVCFALAAILSPTDPVAVQSIAKRSNLPSNILHLVSGESLINDASGLICFKYALAATLTGQFMLSNAVGDFFYISIVGLFVGIVMMYLLVQVRDHLYNHGVNNIVFFTVAYLVTPFVIYFVSEDWLHASGVIAVVAAGITLHLKDLRGTAVNPELTLVTEKTWNTIIYILNGIIFILLGFSLPQAMGKSIQTIQLGTIEPIIYSVLVWLLLLAIRIGWTIVYKLFATNWDFKSINLRIATLSGLSGVRGAVTMVGVLSIPLLTPAGKPFPERPMVLFIAASVIILSLISAIVFIPLLTDNQPVEIDDDQSISEERAQIQMVQSAINEIQRSQNEHNQQAAFDLIFQYQLMLRKLNHDVRSNRVNDFSFNNELALRRIAFSGERKAALKMYEEGVIKKDEYGAVIQIINRRETAMFDSIGMNKSSSNIINDIKSFISGMKKFFLSSRRFKHHQDEALRRKWAMIIETISQSAIQEIRNYLKRNDIDASSFEPQMVDHIIGFYRNRINRVNSANNDDYEQQYDNLQVKGFGAQRLEIQHLLETKQINQLTSNDLRQHINYLENIMMASPASDED